MKTETFHDELVELDKKHFIHPTSSISQQQEHGPSYIFTEGNGIYLTDITGKVVIDGMSSLWNVNVGHGREEISKIAYEQMSKLAFSSCFTTFSNEPAIRLASKIASITPGDLNAVFFTSGGSESIDTAIKFARHYWLLKGGPNRKKILSNTKSFHGVAMGATNATGLKPFRDFTNATNSGFRYVENFSAKSLREKIEQEGPETIAAFISEPVQGAGGVNIVPEGYFEEVRAICDEYEILMITDEIVTGFGRTGKYFGIEHYGVIPDMMCFAKGVTSGYAQLGGVVLSDKVHEIFKELSKGTLFHGYTYSGHPVACKVALKNIEILDSEKLLDNTRHIGNILSANLKKLKNNHKIIKDVRSIGLMGGIEFVTDQITKSNNQMPISPRVVSKASKCGLICRSVIFDQDTLVLAPPLITSKEELDKIFGILDEVLTLVDKELFMSNV